MRRIVLVLVILGVCAACAAPLQVVQPDKPLADQQKDHLECLALASQAAQGAGAWSSSAPIGAAFYDHAKEQYYLQCLQSRGWSFR